MGACLGLLGARGRGVLFAGCGVLPQALELPLGSLASDLTLASLIKRQFAPALSLTHASERFLALGLRQLGAGRRRLRPLAAFGRRRPGRGLRGSGSVVSRERVIHSALKPPERTRQDHPPQHQEP